MKIKTDSDIMRISDLRVLDQERAEAIMTDLSAARPGEIRVIEFDLAHFHAIDCGAVDRLLAIREAVHRADAFIWRLLNPPPDVRQLLELVRLHRVFEIEPPRLSGMAVL